MIYIYIYIYIIYNIYIYINTGVIHVWYIRCDSCMVHQVPPPPPGRPPGRPAGRGALEPLEKPRGPELLGA